MLHFTKENPGWPAAGDSAMNFLQRNMKEETSTDVPTQSPASLLVSQTITFTGNDECNSEDVTAQNIVINSSAGDHNHGSSKVKFKNIVDYSWEHKIHTGQLLAVHTDGKFLAYSLKAIPQPSGKSSGMVRVSHRSTQKRLLIKGMCSQVLDLSFAYITSQILLGCIDEESNVFVHKIVLEADSITHSLILHVSLPSNVGPDHRILWCPFVPEVDDTDPDAEDDCAKLLLATQGNKGYVMNVGCISTRFGVGPLSIKELQDSYLCIEDHTLPIIDAAFSPDGTSLATASCDGFVMFFQIYINGDTPRCLYKWSPHEGKPLSCIFFLDNRNSAEQFWKFVVTGAEKNSVLKVWSCQSWVCLQTIIFAPSPKFSNIALKAGLDQTAKYLLLSDIHRRSLFILHFDHSADDSTGVYCKKVTEFYLPHPILCFGVVDACLKRLKCPSTCTDVYHQASIYHSPNISPIEIKDDENEEINLDSDILSNGHEEETVQDGCNIHTVIRLYLIQPNSLQEGHITFVPLRSGSQMDKSLNLVTANDTLEFKDGLTDLSIQDIDSSVLISSPQKTSPLFEKDDEPTEAQKLNTVLVQQSQQLKNLLMRSQMNTTGFGKQSTSPPVSLQNKSFVQLIPLLPTSSTPLGPTASIQPPLNLMTPDAFSSAKHDEDDPPISSSPEVMLLPPAPILDDNLQLVNNQICMDPPALTDSEQLNSLQNNSIDGKFASGGSSPSREVQEILSIKGSDCFYEDEFDEEMNGQTPRIERQDSSANGSSKPKPLEEDEIYPCNIPDVNMYMTSPQMGHLYAHKSTNMNNSGFIESDGAWPSITIAQLNEANQRKSIDNSEKSSTHSKTNSVNMAMIIDLTENENTANVTVDKPDRNSKSSFSPIQNSEMKSVIAKLDKLATIMHDQQKEITVLRGEIATLRRINQNNITQNNIDDSNSTAKLLEQSLLRNQVQLKQMVDTAIASRVETDRSNREALLSGVSQIMGAQLAEKLSAVVSHETCNTLVPLMQRLIDPFMRSMQVELSRKLTATDNLLTENVQKMVNNKNVTDGLCLAISHALTTSTKEAFKQTIQTSLVPHLEKAQAQMLKQLNQSFSSGTKEYLSAFEGCTKRMLDNVSTVDETFKQVKNVTTHLQTVLDQQNKTNNGNAQTQQAIKQLNSITKELQSAISSSLHGALENQLSPIRECIREQISCGMAAQAAQLEDCVLSAVRSGNQTPAPSITDTQAQQHHIENLLHSGHINAAFQYALSASDLKLVVYACVLADHRKVFCYPCPLQANVLLSLIQQLSADMSSDTQLKCSYLGEAVTYLDTDNPLTKEHMPAVLRELQKQLNSFLIQNPNNSSSRKLKLLLLATESLLKS